MTYIMNTHIYRLVLSTAAICAMLASCDNRLPEPDVPSDEDRVPLELNVKASPATQTKGLIYGTAMPDGSCLGITVVEPDLDTYDGESFINIPYTASSSDGVQIWKPLKNQILLSTTTGNGYAYYPRHSVPLFSQLYAMGHNYQYQGHQGKGQDFPLISESICCKETAENPPMTDFRFCRKLCKLCCRSCFQCVFSYAESQHQ